VHSEIKLKVFSRNHSIDVKPSVEGGEQRALWGLINVNESLQATEFEGFKREKIEILSRVFR
jgi:hypothetical protein